MNKIFIFFILMFSFFAQAQRATPLSEKKIFNTAMEDSGLPQEYFSEIVIRDSRSLSALIERGVRNVGLGRFIDECPNSQARIQAKHVTFKYGRKTHNCDLSYSVNDNVTEKYVYVVLSKCDTEESQAMAEDISNFFIFSADNSTYRKDAAATSRASQARRYLCEIESEDE